MRPQNSVIPFLLRLAGFLIPFCLLLNMLAVVLGSVNAMQTISIAKGINQDGLFIHALHLLDVRVGVDVQVSDTPIMGCCLNWSPDGQRIIFVGEIGQLFIWDVETNQTHQLNLQGHWGGGNLLWLDNQTVFLTIFDDNNDPNVFRFKLDTEDLHQLTFFNNKRVYLWDKAPDKSFLVFSIGPQAFQVYHQNYRVNPDGTELRELGDTVMHRNAVPQIAPDGKQIAYIIERGGRWDIALMDTQGNNSQQVTRTRDFEIVPLWSPDGQHILYESFFGTGQTIHIMDADGANTKVLIPDRLLSYQPQLHSDPAWSPDGSQILFDAAISNAADAGTILYVMEADGSNLHGLYRDNQTWGFIPAWQPQP